MNTPMIRKTLVTTLMLAFCGGAGAAGLGRINVLSTLGQPLRAEIEINASADEMDSMVVRMASRDAYKRAGIDFGSGLEAVKASIERRGGRSVVRIASDKAFGEPFIDVLVDMAWAGGHLQREYTFLLDPAELSGPKPVAPSVQPVSQLPESKVAGRTPQALPRPEARAESAQRSTAASEKSQAASAEAGEYVVQRGDTLNKIAAETRSGEVTQEQMLAALYRSNSDAFIGGNINRLRTGKILKVPEAADVSQIKPAEARGIILKAKNFDAYRNTVAAAAQNRESAGGQSASGKIKSGVVEAGSTNQPKDTVKVTATTTSSSSKSSVQSGDSQANKARIQSLQDENASQLKKLQDTQSRLDAVNKNVEELKKLIEIKTQALAQAQDDAKKANARADKAEAAVKKAGEQSPKKGASANFQAAESSSQVSSAPPVAASQPEAVKPPAEASTPPNDNAAAVSAPEAASAPAEVQSSPAEAQPATPPVAQSVAAPQPQPQPQPAHESDGGLFSNYYLALGGLAAVLAVIAYVFIKQRRKHEVVDAGASQLSESSTTSPNSVFGNAGGQTVDTGGTSLLHTDFSQSGMSAIDADEGVDPVAEADVYMAYGRDAQAEEILLDALKNDPTRTAVYVKLLEIYSQRRALKQFENVATDLYTQTGGVGEDWARAAALGAKLDANNPLYRSSEAKMPEVTAQPEPASEPVVPVPAAPTDAGVSFGTNSISQVRSTWTVPGEVSQLTTGTDAMPVMPEPEPVPAAPLPESINLDFNLDLDAASTEDQPTQLESREEDELPAMEDAVVTHPSAPVAASAAPLEFDIGLDDAASTTTAGVDSPHRFGEETEFDIGIETDGSHEGLAEVDLEKTNFEGSILDFDFELGDEAEKPALDLSNVDLHTAGTAEPAASAPKPAPEPAPTAAKPALKVPEMEPIQDNIDVDDEVATKLELAKAYEEMGDVEGARELLEEVINDGADFQKEQAKTMLGRLG